MTTIREAATQTRADLQRDLNTGVGMEAEMIAAITDALDYDGHTTAADQLCEDILEAAADRRRGDLLDFTQDRGMMIRADRWWN